MKYVKESLAIKSTYECDKKEVNALKVNRLVSLKEKSKSAGVINTGQRS